MSYIDLQTDRTISEPVVINGSLYVFREYLKDYGLSDSYLNKQTSLARNGRTRFYKSISWDKDKRFNLIEYRTIPRATPCSVGKKYELPQPYELSEQYRQRKLQEVERMRAQLSDIQMVDVLIEDEKDNRKLIELSAEYQILSDYDYFLRHEVKLQDFQARGLMKWAGVLRFLHAAYNGGKEFVQSNFSRIESYKELRDRVMKWINAEKNINEKNWYGLNLGNDQSFQRRVNEFGALQGQEALGSIISGKFANVNALRRTYNHEASLFRFYAEAQKLDIRETHRRYVMQMIENGLQRKDTIGYEAARLFLTRDDIQAKAAKLRHGKQYSDTNERPFAMRKKPEVALKMVSGDGIWFGLPVKSIKKVWDDVTKKFVEKTTISKLISFIWYDVASGAIVGWKHNFAQGGETNKMVRESFRRIGHVTGGYFPEEMQLDAKLTKNAHIKSFIERLGVHVRNKKPHNPKDSPAERYHKEINKLLRGMSAQWLNINNHNINFVHNPDAIPYNLENAVNAGTAVGLIDAIFTIYNNIGMERLGGLSPIEYLKAHISPNAKQYTEFSSNMLFNETSVVTINNGTFKLQYEKTKYEYEVPNWHDVIGSTNKNKKIRVYYNEEQMQEVQICSFTDENNAAYDKFICNCKEVERFDICDVDRTDDDKRILVHHANRIEAYDKAIDKAANTYTQYAIDMGGALETNQDYYKEYVSEQMFSVFKQVDEQDALERGVALKYPELTIHKKQRIGKAKQLDEQLLDNIDLSIYQ